MAASVEVFLRINELASTPIHLDDTMKLIARFLLAVQSFLP
jgi:hypothetical protein